MFRRRLDGDHVLVWSLSGPDFVRIVSPSVDTAELALILVAVEPNRDMGSPAFPQDRLRAIARASSGDGSLAALAKPCLLAHPSWLPRRTGHRQERRAGESLGQERSQPRCPSKQEFPSDRISTPPKPLRRTRADRERAMLVLRYGLCGSEPKTLNCLARLPEMDSLAR
jgi:hypothetical protein